MVALTEIEIERMEDELRLARMRGVPAQVGKKRQQAPRVYRTINVKGRPVDLEIVPSELVSIRPEGYLAAALKVLLRRVSDTQVGIFACKPPVIVNNDGIYLLQHERGRDHLNELTDLEKFVSGSREDRRFLSACGIFPKR